MAGAEHVTIETTTGGVTLENCRDALELSVTNEDEVQYTELTEEKALELAHQLIAMVMRRRSA
jgi:hypothetical protein